MKDIRTVMPNKEKLDAETFIEKEGLRMMTSEETDKHFEDIRNIKSDYIRDRLIHHTWTELSIDGEDEDGNYKSGYQITNGIWNCNSTAYYISEKPWNKEIRIGNTTLSVQAGDIWAESWYENSLLEECA
jgi:hypothetical protein